MPKPTRKLRVDDDFIQLMVNSLMMSEAAVVDDRNIFRNCRTRYTLLRHEVGGANRVKLYIDWLISKIGEQP